MHVARTGSRICVRDYTEEIKNIIIHTMKKDTQINTLIALEKARQKKVTNLIASENYVSKDILAALGSELTNKYAEGYPHKRYYKGQINVDKIEDIAIERALELFKLSPKKWHVNVQALSGSPANLAVYTALVPQHDKIMGLSLNHGGHLTHGHKVSATGKFWTSVQFELSPKTERLDYTEIQKLAEKEKPTIIVAGFTAYPCIVDFKKFRAIADACGALLMVDMSHFAGLVAGGEYPTPFRYADIVTATMHKTLRGPRSALIFSKIDDRELGKKIDRAVFPGLQGGPHMNQIAATAIALHEAMQPSFKTYAKQVVKNAQALAAELSRLGWRVVSGGTDTHVMLVDTWMGGKGVRGIDGSGLSGEEASTRLEEAGIIVNKNGIPFDTRGPMDPSGIRLGSAAETTRGKKEKDFVAIARRIDKVLRG